MRVGTLLLQISGFLVAHPSVCAFVAPQSSTTSLISFKRTTTPTRLSLVGTEMLEATDFIVSQNQVLLAAEYPVSPEPIHSAFQLGTFFAQPFFLLMILFPKASITKKIMGGLGTW